jgi:predicted membrane-bound dolichyl-phosphate-mannose-protein mannosyltransferase
LSHQTEVDDVEAVEIIFATHNAKTQSGFIAAAIAALLIAFSPNLYAQSSPLTV